MNHRRLLVKLGLVAAVSACHSQPIEPAPPAASYELVMAPPGARGAAAAGTDAAPPEPSESEGEPAPPGTGNDDAPEPPVEPDVDGGIEAPPGSLADAAPAVAL